MPVKTFDPKKHIVTYKGIVITGYDDGTFINVTWASDTFTKKVGADGEVARTLSNDHTAEATFTLMQTSDSNSSLSSFHQQDILTGIGSGPLSITDLNGTATFFWPEAWIKKSPDYSVAKELGNRAWVFDTGQPTEQQY